MCQTQAKIIIADREYTSWRFVDMDTFVSMDCPSLCKVNPIQQKVFTRDIFSLESGEVIYSPIRQHQHIAGILMLSDNKTYGRSENKKRLLYKCIPDDKYLPAFLVPYEVKLGFSKRIENKYVVIQFDKWPGKHPCAQLVEVIGDVGSLYAFYEYQIHCRSLHISLTEFTNTTRSELNRRSSDEYIQLIQSNPDYKIHTYSDLTTQPYIFSIDPVGSLDFDDAFSIFHNSDTNNTEITIYIANVYFWLDTLNLWKSFSKRVSTIYLPDRKRPMLPTVLSDSLCSLVQNEKRFVLAMTVEIDNTNSQILFDTVRFRNECVIINRNFTYDSLELLCNPCYCELAALTRSIERHINTSHDVVSFWMVQMNRICGSKLLANGCGIFRTMKFIDKTTIHKDIPEEISDGARMCIQNWNNTTGQYVVATHDNTSDELAHEIMDVKCYTHITSPIRRLVDLLNQMIFMREFGLIQCLSPISTEFLTHWLSQIDYINVSMRSIRKVQTDCEILYKCTNTPEIIDNEHIGIVFDRVARTDGMYSYVVFLEDVGILSRISVIEKWENYEKHRFRIYLFDSETKLCTKIRLLFVNPTAT